MDLHKWNVARRYQVEWLNRNAVTARFAEWSKIAKNLPANNSRGGIGFGATTNIHNAVQGGLNYLGICAGGLLAGNAACNSLNLTSGGQGEVNEGRQRRNAAPPIS
jgi:hypothetical protein